MTDRYFANNMPQYVPETSSTVTSTETETKDNSLLNLLSTDYKSFASLLERLALDIKETVVIETWGRTGQKVVDFSLYAGTLGTAFLLFKAYQVTKNVSDLNLCLEIVKACDLASSSSRDVTFICGRAGVYALGAVVAKHMGDKPLMNYYLTQFKQINLPRDIPNELLYGRAGFLWSCLFLNKHVGDGTIPSTLMRSIASDIIEDGRRMPNKGSWPLMFEWYGERYWGAAHGLTGILHVLMDTDLKPDEREDVKNELLCMIKHRFPSGNFPASEVDKGRDVLVHWCHGAPGIALTLVKAYEVFKDIVFLDAAIEAAEVVWNRGLLKRVGICHGISGNAYVFLSLYRATGNMCYLYKAKAFAAFLIDNATTLIAAGEMHGGDNPYSLFEGIGGMAYLFLDMIEPTCSGFPGYEL
ncbi:lanC-like protein GCL2 [Silene latifolia]|uniref:lanC-like protein GCL2 n=1 Tax=Silene latifolia TaxID=37657 RepID=UPI003D77EB15